MKTKTVNLSADDPTTSIVIHWAEIKLKGQTNVIFNYDLIPENYFAPLKLYVDFGDNTVQPYIIDYDIIKDYVNTDLTLRIARTGKLNNVLQDITHTYAPTSSAYFTQLTANFICTFANFNTVHFKIPLKIAQDSFYTSIERVNLIDTQMISTSGNDILLILQTQQGQVFNSVLSK